MDKWAVILTALSIYIGISNAANAADWTRRSIYQVITDRFALTDGSTDVKCDDLNKYCGGTWAGLIKKLDYIQDMGFTAILISPVVQNIENDTIYGQAYHGYWPVDNYALNPHFGNAEDLKDLSKELHDRDMYLMVDVVINNMAQAIDGSMPQPIDYSVFNPFDDVKYFHPYCNITDWENPLIAQNCYLSATGVALPDLYTESNNVVEMTGTWIKELVTNYSIDGLRIDAAKHVNDAFLPLFNEAAGVFTLGEVYTGEVMDLCRYQELGLLSGLPNFLEYFPLIRAFTAGAMQDLAAAKVYAQQNCNNTVVLATFAENQDLPRFATIDPDVTLAMNAMAFVILNDGIPYVYQGQEQHMTGNYSPYNRDFLWSTNYDTAAPLYNLTATLNRIRNHAIVVDSLYVSDHSKQLYYDDSTLCTRKGPDGVQIVACFSNQGSKGGDYNLTVPGGFSINDEVIEVLSCKRSYAWGDGNVTAEMGQGLPKVFFPVSNMNGTGLCGFSLDGTSQDVVPTPSTKATGTASVTTTGKKPKKTKHRANGAETVKAAFGIVLIELLLVAGIASLL